MRLPALISSFVAILGVHIVALGTPREAVAADTDGALQNLENEVCALYDQAQDAVVKIHAEHQIQIGNLALPPMHRVGTGFFIDAAGRLLTAATVVRGADTCWIDWRGRKIYARLLGQCERTNLAVLQINQPSPFLRQGDSDALRVGSVVVAVGFPYDMPSAPVLGVVNGLDIRRGTNVFVTSHLRASCHLSPGQAGSPLFNPDGEVVAVAVAAHQNDQCYALPINAARRVYTDIINHGAPQYGWVGLDVKERRRSWPETSLWETELIVQQVFSNTPAATAGFLPGDEVVKVQSREVHSLSEVLDAVFHYRSGQLVSFTVRRGATNLALSVRAGTRPGDDNPALSRPQLVEDTRRGPRPPRALFPIAEH